MNDKEFNKKERQKLIIVGAFCLIAIISVIGYTYSYFTATATNTGTITGTVASASLSLNVTKVAPDTDKALVPQLDSAIASAVVGTEGNCIDDNLNAVCQVYQVTVTNTSTMTINVDGLLELNAGSNPNLKWALISSYADGITTKPTVTSSIKSYAETTITANEEYTANQTKTYYIVVWISETSYVQSDTGSFTGTVTFANSEDASAAATTLYSLGIAPKKDVLTTLTATSNNDGTTGVYKTEDDLGTSYYFRGNVTNNYVYFANKYWRIIRINGDGTIRMIYDGTSAHANGESSTDRSVTTLAYNTNYADNAFVGYMNGTTDGTNFPNGTTNSISYEEAHANLTNSTIKEYIENTWYKTNIADAGYGSYVADAIYCNDRTITTNQDVVDLFNTKYADYGMSVTNEGFGGDATKVTLYGIYKRYNFTSEGELVSMTPNLKCERQDDRFTSEATVGSVAGNDKLAYPVGLLTTDEAFLAGGYSARNSSYYLYTGHNFWALSPGGFDLGYANVGFVGSGGGALNYIGFVNISLGVRPVVSLSSSAITGGNGTISSPFTI